MNPQNEQASVEQWGYRCGSSEETHALVWPVRFKPGFTFLLVLIGLLFKQPYFLMAVGLLGILGSIFPKISWIDASYEHLVRPLFKSHILGTDPFMRRFICGLADLFVSGAGLAVFLGKMTLAWIFGGIVLLLAGTVVLSGVCLPLYMIYKMSKRSPY